MSLLNIIGAVLLGPLKLIFEVIFSVAYDIIGRPGPAIIVLSLVMNILVLPLYRRADAIQEEARDTENKLKDVVAHIKKTFKGDERMMILQTYYRQNNYNPLSVLSGSVSLLLEIPFFMAAYQFLSGVQLFKGVSFGPITDLSEPDGLLLIGGISINLLPIIMTLVNVVSSSLYLKGFPLKSKIQLYGMALFFLVFLYNSPSALVFYWTLNNVFSLVKTLFYKMKNAGVVLKVLLSVCGVASVIMGIYLVGFWRSTFFITLGVALQLTWIVPLVKNKLPLFNAKSQTVVKPNKKLFIIGGLFLTVLVGLMIPGTYVAASPQEYIEADLFYNPIWYVVNALCLSAGTFLVWMGVFYWLANAKGKVIFERLVWAMSGIMLINYMCFGTKLGILSPNLSYKSGFSFAKGEQLINIAVIILMAVVLTFLAKKFSKGLVAVLLIGTIALTGVGAVNLGKIAKSASDTKKQIMANTSEMPTFNLSKDGKNVVVIMLDRGIGPFVPYIFEEYPSLVKQFDGFTNYTNTLSYGGCTNFGAPALYGGYEYTPLEMNLRDSEKLVDKHNEALKVLPTLFAEEGYEATMIDPSYAGYKWIPDLSIYDDSDGVSAYLADGMFNGLENSKVVVAARKRNFFLFSLMKTLPVSLQPLVYTDGTYRSLTSDTIQGVEAEFLSAYNVMKNMDTMTNITADSKNTFMFIRSNLAHEPILLQEPGLTPSNNVDNSSYYPPEGKTITAGDKSLLLKYTDTIAHYQVNALSLMKLGEWFDYLRENGAYDNTRIILVSDHGSGLGLFGEADQPMENIDFYMPMLMVKDFNSKGFTTSDEFMTNADVPTIALNGLIDSPVNPFTGKAINSVYKSENEKQYVFLSNHWDVDINSGTQFIADEWASVTGKVYVKDNWTFYNGETELPPGYFK